MGVAAHPLHRSGRARLAHPALALGGDARPTRRILMTYPLRLLAVSAPAHFARLSGPVPGSCFAVAISPWPAPFAPPAPPSAPHYSGRAAFVRGLRRYYGSVRLPASVHHRRTSLDFSMRPKGAALGGCRLSRFSRKLLPCLPGVFDRAGYPRPSPERSVGCGLPLAATGSASRTKPFSRLNTQPALSPVNASPDGLLHPTHDSGPLWLASPLTYDSSIHYNLPVYPGALSRWLCLADQLLEISRLRRLMCRVGFCT